MNMWQTVAASLMAALAAATVIGTVKFSAPRVKGRWTSRRKQRAALKETRHAAREKEQRERARQDKIAAARAEGKVIPISRRGRHPVEVTYSDGTTSYFFCGDMDAYRDAMNSGRYPLTRTFHTSPPKIE